MDRSKNDNPLAHQFTLAEPSHGHSHGHAHGDLPSHGGLLDFSQVRKTSHPGHGVSALLGFVEQEGALPRASVDLLPGAGKGKVLFFQLSSGIAGDMIIASLLDLGVPLQVIKAAVDALGLRDVHVLARQGYAGAIGCTHFSVQFAEQGHERSYKEIVELIGKSQLDRAVQELSLRIFEKLGRAEADVHNTSLDEVHFHEVGAIDSIVDIVGAAAAFVHLGATVKASPVPLGTGFVECRHGVLPLPAPATVSCLLGVPTYDSGLQCELVTPTGAAILATLAEEYSPWVALRPQSVGWGAGTRGMPDRPNVLRAILGEETKPAVALTHVLLEANLDDMSGEVVAHALSQVMQAGALDCWIVPATMKKGRPGMIFCALTEILVASSVAESILKETTSIGVRQTLVSRYELPRRIEIFETPLGPVRCKLSGSEETSTKWKPELEDCLKIALESRRPLIDVLASVNGALSHLVNTTPSRSGDS